MQEQSQSQGSIGVSSQSRLNYLLIPNVYDEMLDKDGRPRAHWEHVMHVYSVMGQPELDHRQREIRRVLRETGANISLLDSANVDQFWQLDPIPALFTSQEWNDIEMGLAQRGELFSLILKDVYGPRKLIKEGILPPEVVYSSPSFLRPCAITPTKINFQLPFYSADIMRGANGAIWVLNDITQSPAGLGYVLKNRMTLSRVFPSLFRDSHVHRLAKFFRNIRSMLLDLARERTGSPRVVMLTPGPEHDSFYEHSLLANYLGILLAQNEDLTVRDGSLKLKTLDGLQTVDVLFREVADTHSDPLNLNPDTSFGIPGLLHSSRLGKVVTVNPFGSGFLENAGLLPFLPAISQYFLGEELRIPSVATWWCGQEAERKFVLDNLERMVIKPIDPQLSQPIVFGSLLNGTERQNLSEIIKTSPHLYVGQEHNQSSTTPVYVNGALEPRSTILRAYLIHHNDEYVALPGGLTRVSSISGHGVVNNHSSGGLSKDTWLLASEPEEQTELHNSANQSINAFQNINITPVNAGIPSRIAENLFWLGRYAERTESNARLMREIVIRCLDTESVEKVDYIPILLKALAHQISDVSLKVNEAKNAEEELLNLIFDRNRIGGLPFNIQALEKTARSVRDRLSDDAHRFISKLEIPSEVTKEMNNALEVLEFIIFVHSALAGLLAESMSRGQGHSFLDIGRRIERGINTISLLQSIFLTDQVVGTHLCDVTLSVTDSHMTYRRRYRTPSQALPVLDMLLFDEQNPRTVAYQIASLDNTLSKLPDKSGTRRHSSVQRIAMQTLTLLRTSDVDAISLKNQIFPSQLDHLLNALQMNLSDLSDALIQKYFNLLEKPHQLVGIA